MLLAACLMVSVVSACSLGGSGPPPTTIVNGKSLLLIRVAACHGDCPAVIRVGDVILVATNNYLRPQFTNGELVAVGRDPVVPDQARRLPGVTSPWLLAMETDGLWTVGYGADNSHFPSRADMEKVFVMVCDQAGLPYSTLSPRHPGPCAA